MNPITIDYVEPVNYRVTVQATDEQIERLINGDSSLLELLMKQQSVGGVEIGRGRAVIETVHR